MHKRDLYIVLTLSLFTVFWFNHNSFSEAPPVNLGDYGLKEGDLIGAVGAGDPDVFVVNGYGYRRLFLNPTIFNFYGHLGRFRSIKPVSVPVRDTLLVSFYVRNCETNDSRVYVIKKTGDDTATLHWLNSSPADILKKDPQFFKKVFCINTREYSWYEKGSNYTSLDDAPKETESTLPAPETLSVQLTIDGSGSDRTIVWNSNLRAEWKSSGASRCEGFNYIPLLPNETVRDKNDLALSGAVEIKGRVNIPLAFESFIIQVACFDTHNNYTDDYITLTIDPGSVPKIHIDKPSVGSELNFGDRVGISWRMENYDAPVRIFLAKGRGAGVSGLYWELAKDVENSGTFSWLIRQNEDPNIARGTTLSEITPGEYYILIMDHEEIIMGTSALFTIQ